MDTPPAAVPFALRVTPHGALERDPFPPGESAIDAELASRLEPLDGAAAAFELGACVPTGELPPGPAYFRDVAKLFFTRLCALPDLESLRDKASVPAPAGELARLAAEPPPMTGAEYVSAAMLESLWNAFDGRFRECIAAHTGTVQEWLRARNPAWNLVGRVCFHVAENKRDEKRPFAFLATYTTALSGEGAAKHRPLGQAVRESADTKDKSSLLALLLPVQRAAEQSALVRGLVDSGAVFHPLAWTPAEALRFLHEVPLVEQSGVVVRVPDWWKPRAPPRVSVQVTVGDGKPAGLGAGAMLDFDVGLSLDGQALTPAEWARLRAETSGLVSLRGRWVEIDRERLDALLAQWDEARRAAREGIPFLEAMRLLSGAGRDGAADEAPDEDAGWTRVVAGKWLENTLASLRGPEALARANPGDALKAVLRPYQELGVRWLWFLNRLQLGACLADDMGLGKTVQVLALLLLLKRERPKAPHLLVVPASLVSNWMSEAGRFAPELKLFAAHPSAAPAAELERLERDGPRDADVVLTTYGTLLRAQWPARTEWDTVVLDEAQAIKNPGAKQTRAAKAIKARAKLALTGTPVENRPGDLWSLFDFLSPGLLGSAAQFTKMVKNASSHGYGPLRELVRPYVLRRLKTDRRVIADLPEKTEIKAWCGLVPAQAALYERVVAELARALKDVDGIQRRGLVLATLLKLKQICNHPSQWLGDGAFEPSRSGKFERLAELVEPVAARQEKALVFTQFREMTEPLARRLAELFGRPGVVLHGGTPVKQRKELVDRFQTDDAVPFFVLSVKAGGTGLNLTAASHVVHFDRWWNPAVENQATDRAFRIGQKRAVMVHKLVCRGTVEEKIDAMLEDKRALAGELLEGGGEALLTEMPDDELLRTVALDAGRALARE